MQDKLVENKSNLDFYIEMIVLLLMATGTVFVFSAGASVQANYDLKQFYNFTTLKQLFFFPMAIFVMYLVSMVDYQRFSFRYAAAYKSYTPYFLGLALILLVLVLIPGIGVEKNMARRWLVIPLGPASISFQPSEFAKWILIIFLAAYLDKNHMRLNKYFKSFLPPCLIAGVFILLIITQDFGTAAFIALLTFLMLAIGGAVWWHFLTAVPVLVPAFCGFILISPTRINRIKAFINPSLAPHANYQAEQSLIAISTGGIWGKGLGRGISKYGHLPEDTTDFIFAIICEEFGFIGAAFVICLFVALMILCFLIILRCKDRFGKLLASGITFSIIIQALINLGVVTKVLPTKGIALPFVSAGGSSMLLTTAAVGLLLNIAKQRSPLPASELP